MSKLSDNLRGYNTRTRIPLNEPWDNHFQVDTMTTAIAPELGCGEEYKVSVEWAVTFTLSPEVAGETTRQQCKETALNQFNREVYGEFEPLLFEMEREVGKYMFNEKMMKLIHEMRRRMNE